MTTVTEPAPTRTDVLARRTALRVSRSALAELTGLTGAKIWRCEDGRPKDGELALITTALDRVERDGLPEHLRPKVRAERPAAGPSKAELVDRLGKVTALLDEAAGAKTVREIRALVEQAQATAHGVAAGTDTTDNTTDNTES